MGRNVTLGLLFLLVVGITLGYASDQIHEPASQNKAHEAISCTNCHTLVASSQGAAATKSRSALCRDCHKAAADTTSWAALFHKDPTRSCADCHSFHNSETIKTLDGEMAINDAQLTAFICQTCHISGQELDQVSPGHRQAAAEYYHSNRADRTGESPSEVCLSCHSDHTSYSFQSQETAIPINLNASHTIGADVRQLDSKKRRTEIDQKIRLLENRIECQTCHSLSSGKKDALVNYDNPYDLCYGCHTIRG